MASCITSQFGSSYCPQARLTVNQSSSTDTTATLSWTLEYVAHGYAAKTNGYGRDYSVIIDGTTVKSGTYNINGISSTKTITSGSVTVDKFTSVRSVAFSVSFEFDVTWSGTYGGTKSASGSISIDAKTSYTITYNANGGSGVPSSQTKWHGTNLMLSTTVPTFTGYTFQGWSDSATGSKKWDAGDIYTSNASCTLYALWKANTYTVAYNANGGSGVPGNQTKTYGVNLTLSSTRPTRTNYNFLGWGTSASSTTVSYASGATYSANASITLYAIWEVAYTPPKITKFTADRCDTDGTLNDEGTYVKVAFTWNLDTTYSGGISSILVGYKLSTATSYTNSTVSATGMSGTVSTVIGGGNISIESQYDIQVIVEDTKGSSTVSTPVSAVAFIIDFLAGGGGVAFNKPAEVEGMDINERVIIRDPARGIFGAHPDSGELYHQFQPINTTGNCVLGYGLFNAGLGETNIYGNYMTLNAKTGFVVKGSDGNAYIEAPISEGGYTQIGYGSYENGQDLMICGKKIRIYSIDGGIEGRGLGENVVIWSGAYQMNASQTITLSESILSQPHGIVLIFSRFVDGSAKNEQMVCQFVPKYYISPFSGAGVTINCSSHWKHGMKYLYITNGTIVGHDYNSIDRTRDGITYENSYWALRYVIGV